MKASELHQKDQAALNKELSDLMLALGVQAGSKFKEEELRQQRRGNSKRETSEPDR